MKSHNANLKNTSYALLSCVSILLLSACSVLPKKPWVESYERGYLEDELMQPTRHEAVNRFRQHTYRTTEAASGATAYNGGGCGCK